MYSFDEIQKIDPQIAEVINKEINRQQSKIELIASENFTSKAVMAAMGTPLTNKYAEGYPNKRYYGGCEYVDIAEDLARERAMQLFNAEHANVQPHSGAQANMAVFFAVLKPGDTVLGMDLSHGGHLSHGMAKNISGSYFNVVSYGVKKDTSLIDYDHVREQALKHKPKMIICGASAYPRIIDFKAFKEIADEVGAYLMADIAHIAGLVTAGLHPSPIPYADFVTTTTHKTLRGPRGGLILCEKENAKLIDSAVFPGIQGGPLMHIIAAKAVSFKEALTDDFKLYQQQVIKNAAKLSEFLKISGFDIVSGGTDNHLMLVDLSNIGVTGKDAQIRLDEIGITVNKNGIPYDTKSPFITSGIRIGTPAVTTRGMREKHMEIIALLIKATLIDDSNIAKIKQDVIELTNEFPLYE